MALVKNEIRKIVIVGGGTAGWLAANHLAKKLNCKHNNDIRIQLIESKNIATIGVGEGTVPLMRQTLHYLGISETEFIRECDATFKQGIKFVNWLNTPKDNRKEYYHHVFDYPYNNNIDLTPYWLLAKQHNPISFVDAVSVQGKVCDAGLAPKLITSPEYSGLTAYAYHLDAAKFAKILTRNAVNNLGVEHIQTEVEQVILHDNGEIKALLTSTQGEIEGDFFIDCTGFKSLLIGQALGIEFIDKSKFLFADHAVAIQVPYENEQAPIPSYTISTALDNGWVWDIGLKHRRGVGHVYSSRYISHDQAEAQLRDYIGAQAEGVASRLIKMKIGYREKFWTKNCVALGLAQGFVEPLEATGLLVFDATARMLAEQFPHRKNEMKIIAKQFNRRVRHSWDNVIDFVKLHYCLSKRNDSQFWLDNRDENSIPETLKEQLALWRYQPPHQYDFSSRYDVFNLENYLYILYGMHYPTEITAHTNRLPHQQEAQEVFNHVAKQTQQILSRLPKHRELIEKIHQYGLQPC